jgi:hypothetical protein
MKKIFLYTLIYLSANFSIFSQSIGFEKGEIITKTNDTIKALIEFSPTYENVVQYKVDTNSRVQRVKINDILILKTNYNTFKHYSSYNKPILFRVASTGKISLLEFVKYYTGKKTYAYGGTVFKYSPPSITYAIESGSDVYFIKKKKDLNQIISIVNTCPDAKAIIDKKSFKLENLKDVINKLNVCDK